MSGVAAFGNREPPRYTGPILGSVVLHAVIIAALVWQVDWSGDDEDLVAARIIDAEVVDSGVLEKIEKAKEKEAAERAEQLRRERLAEQRVAEQAAAAERERREALQLAEQKKREEQQRLEQQRLAEEQQRREEQARREAEQERLRQDMAAEEQRLREQAQRAEWERLQAEEQAAREQARARELAGQKALYVQAIRQRVQRHWIRPLSAEDGDTCEVIVHQIPGGDIVNVEFGACDGDAVFQRSVRNAVYKAAPLPDPPDPALFERRLVFEFKVQSE